MPGYGDFMVPPVCPHTPREDPAAGMTREESRALAVRAQECIERVREECGARD